MNPAPPNWHYVYLLKSRLDDSVYIGCTSNLNKRLEEHNNGKVYSTKRIFPVDLIYYEAYIDKIDAFKREKKLKQHGSALRNLKLRIEDTLSKGGAG